MEINKQLFEDVISGKLTGKFVLRNGDIYVSASLNRNYNKRRDTYPYTISSRSYTYTRKGRFFYVVLQVTLIL